MMGTMHSVRSAVCLHLLERPTGTQQLRAEGPREQLPKLCLQQLAGDGKGAVGDVGECGFTRVCAG